MQNSTFRPKGKNTKHLKEGVGVGGGVVVGWLVECCFTSTETVGLLGTGSREPRTATSIFTQHLSSQESVPLVEFMYLVFTRTPGESYVGDLGLC